MPGICGIAAPTITEQHQTLFLAMLKAQAYEQCAAIEKFGSSTVIMGCAHLDQIGQDKIQAVYESDRAAVCFYGWLLGKSSHNSAHYIHDLYVEKEEQFIKEIDGSFVVAVFDKGKKSLLLCNNCLGALPIYYARSGQDLSFASEVKALLQDRSLKRSLDLTAVAEFFSFGHILGSRTFFEEIHMLPPASILRYQDGQVSMEQYWEAPYPDSYPHRPDRYYDDLIYDALRQAVEGIIEPDKRHGVLLGGGRDSRWLAVLLHLSSAEFSVLTTSSPYDEPRDVKSALDVTDMLGDEHHLIPFPERYFAEYGERIAYILEGLDIHGWVLFDLVLQAHRYADILVTGQTGGTLLGYVPLKQLGRKGYNLAQVYESQRQGYLDDAEMGMLFGQKQYGQMKEMAYSFLKQALAQSSTNSDIRADIMKHYNFYHIGLRHIMFGSHLAAAPCADMRCPHVTRLVFEASLQLPPGQRLYKRALTRSFCSHFPALADIPWAKPSLPPSHRLSSTLVWALRRIVRAKLSSLGRGAATRQGSYDDEEMRGPLRDFVESTLFGKEANKLELFDQEHLRQMIDAHMNGARNLWRFISLLITFELWCQQFYLPPVPKPPESMSKRI